MFPSLKDRIQSEKNRLISYDTFIQYALYDQEKGYYNLSRPKVGKEGDFYTSSHIHHVFSQVLANYFIQISQSLEIPLHICEIGSGDGTFAKEVCEFLSKQGFDYIYDAVELSSEHRVKTSQIVKGQDAFHMFESLEEWQAVRKEFNGILFSNEWLDAQPVKVVTKQNGELYEVCIGIQENDTLEEVLYPCPQDILDWLSSFNYQLIEGQRVEIPFYMDSLYEQISQALQKGIMLTIDYGYTHMELSHPARISGSLRGYANHHMKDNVLQKPGEMDITHHVHWDTWMKIGEKYGFRSKLMKQKDFLLEASILDFLTEHASKDPFSEEHKRNRAIRSFIMGDQIADSFEVCVQAKGIELPEDIKKPMR